MRAQALTEQEFAAAVAIIGRGVEIANTAGEGGGHGRSPLLVAEREAKAANRRAAEAEGAGRERCGAQLAPFKGLARHAVRVLVSARHRRRRGAAVGAHGRDGGPGCQLGRSAAIKAARRAMPASMSASVASE